MANSGPGVSTRLAKAKLHTKKAAVVYKTRKNNAKDQILRSASVPNISSSVSIKKTKNGKVIISKRADGVDGPSQEREPPVNREKLTSEEREMIRIEEEKKKAQELIMNNKKSYSDIKSRGFSKSIAIAPSAKEPTIPKTPNMKLTQRLGRKTCSLERGLQEVIVPRENPTHSGPTTIKPFVFETEKRAKIRGSDILLSSVIPIIPAAEIEQNFMRDPRSHDVPINAAKRLTEPKTPNLMTKRRAASERRCSNLKSREVMEQEEMEEIAKNPFKARPVDRRIFESSEPIGAPKVSPRQLTEPQPFHLRIDKRSSIRSSIAPSTIQENKGQFKALPLPSFPNRPISPRPPETKKPLTRPVSPKLHGQDRASSAPACRQKPHHSEIEKIRQQELEAYKHEMTALSRQEPLKMTQPKEFHFRTQERTRSQRSTRESMDVSVDSFKAKPAPKFGPAPKPTPSKKPLTEIQEFSLRSVSRHNYAKSAFEKKAEEIRHEESKLSTFNMLSPRRIKL